MSRKLVAYFSASGHTAKVAEHLAEAIGADLFEIAPRVRYTKKDLDWQDQASRSSVEMRDPSCRPEMEMLRDNMADYDTVYLGFPIWWYVAPRIINTFLEAHDLSSKTIIPFATSGGSGLGDTVKLLASSCNAPDAILSCAKPKSKIALYRHWSQRGGITCVWSLLHRRG